MAVVGRRLAKPALPDGPLKDLNDALHDLLRRAGRPSLRVLGADIREDKLLKIPPSHTRIYDVFIRARVPDCDLMSCLVQVMARRAHRLDPGLIPDTEGERFYQLWLAADEADRQETYAILEIPPRANLDTISPVTEMRKAPVTETILPTATHGTDQPDDGRLTGSAYLRLGSEADREQCRDRQHIMRSPLLPDPDQSRAVFIGMAKYTVLTDLPAVEASMQDLREVLTHPITGSFSHSTSSLVLDPSTAAEALNPLEEAAAEARDTLFLHISCHGLVSSYSGGLSLAIVDSRPFSSFTTIPYDWVRELVTNCPARRRVIMLDCCYSGRALGAMGAGDLVAAAEIEGTYLISATAGNNVALSPGGERYTSFTGELIDLLRGGISDGPEVLDLDLIYRNLSARLRAKGRPQPQRSTRSNIDQLGLISNSAIIAPLTADQ
ncbi:hypothetical protein AB0L53_07795 [Nonomuraea sp. NPDC052129]|uniref:caspase family protein n=1 Tax=Nonomuraea sp. NPDC052129 TaxID=3154651 RepID=UPI00343FBDE7